MGLVRATDFIEKPKAYSSYSKSSRGLDSGEQQIKPPSLVIQQDYLLLKNYLYQTFSKRTHYNQGQTPDVEKTWAVGNNFKINQLIFSVGNTSGIYNCNVTIGISTGGSEMLIYDNQSVGPFQTWSVDLSSVLKGVVTGIDVIMRIRAIWQNAGPGGGDYYSNIFVEGFYL